MSQIDEFLHILISVILLCVKLPYYISKNIFRNIFALKKCVRDEIVLITGTGHGLGRELALQYASLGATIVCLDINKEANEETANEVKQITKKQVYAYQCDVTDSAQVFEVAEKVKREVGIVTVLINNAGVIFCRKYLDQTTDQIKKQFNVNILSQFWMTQAFLPGMMEKNHGHIVAMSSIAGYVGLPYLTAYCASKYAVRGFMNALNEELRISTEGKSLIKFTTIFPNMMDTGFCKKPKIKCPTIMPLISPKEAAAKIIRAQRQNVVQISIPSYWIPVISIIEKLPYNVQWNVRDFVDCGVEPDE